jgi:hypothetical protein
MVSATRGMTPVNLPKTFVNLQSQYEPFSWAKDVDWESISKRLSSHHQLTKWKRPTKTQFTAIFYPAQWAMATLPLNNPDMVLPSYFMTSILNSMSHSGHQGSKVYDPWIKLLTSSTISMLYRALPEPLIDVLLERTFAHALLAGDTSIVVAMLRLGVNPRERINIPECFGVTIMDPLYLVQLSSFPEVAKVLVTHTCQHGTVKEINANPGTNCQLTE